MNLIIIHLFRYFHNYPKFLRSYFMIDWKKCICINNILSDCQFGFRTGRYFSMAIVNLKDEITNSLDNAISVISVFIDLEMALDKFDHTILLLKLNHYGIRRIVYQGISSYLHIGSNTHNLKEQNPIWKVLYVAFHNVQFSAINCLIYILMTFLIYQTFFNLL